MILPCRPGDEGFLNLIDNFDLHQDTILDQQGHVRTPLTTVPPPPPP